jgi:GntR family transcriptional regulator
MAPVFVLSPHSGTPIYRQLIEQVRRLVASGQLVPGDTLPSVRALALEHAVNPMTISKAYAALEAEGWLERHRGKPMTVAASRGGARRTVRHTALEGPMRELILAARQLELGREDVAALFKAHWEKTDD